MKQASAGFCLVVLASGGAWAADPPPERPAIQVKTARPGTVSITASEVALEDLLREVSRVTGLAVYFETGMDSRVTRRPTSITVRDAPLDDVLRRLLRDTSYVVGYGADRIDEVKIFASGAGPFTRLAVASGGPGHGSPSPRGRPSPSASPAAPVDAAGLETAALNHPDPAERAAALSRLGEMSDEARAREVALSALDREQHPDVLREALNVLEMQDELPRERLMRFIEASHPPQSRMQALDLLADSGTNDAAFRRLVTSLTRDQNEEVRQRAREILEDLDVDEDE
jgi:hypothetical protein